MESVHDNDVRRLLPDVRRTQGLSVFASFDSRGRVCRVWIKVPCGQS